MLYPLSYGGDCGPRVADPRPDSATLPPPALIAGAAGGRLGRASMRSARITQERSRRDCPFWSGSVCGPAQVHAANHAASMAASTR